MDITKTEDRFTGYDGTSLYCETHLCQKSRGIIILAHGYAEHCGRYQHVIAYLNKLGFNVYTFDQRGHGKSSGKKGLIEDINHWVNDLEVVVKRVLDCAKLPVFILGHSAGGQIALNHNIAFTPEVEGLILSAPAVKSDLSPFMQKLAQMAAKVIPTCGVVKTDPYQLISRDKRAVERLLADDLCYHGRMMAKTGASLLEGMQKLKGHYSEVTCPLLVLQGTADRYVSPSGTEEFFHQAGAADKKFISYEGCYHELFNEIDAKKVLLDLGNWLHNKVPDGDFAEIPSPEL